MYKVQLGMFKHALLTAKIYYDCIQLNKNAYYESKFHFELTSFIYC